MKDPAVDHTKAYHADLVTLFDRDIAGITADYDQRRVPTHFPVTTLTSRSVYYLTGREFCSTGAGSVTVPTANRRLIVLRRDNDRTGSGQDHCSC